MPTTPPAPLSTFSRHEESGTDLAEAVRVRSSRHGGRDFRARLADEPFSYHYVTVGDSRLGLQTTRFTAYLQGTVPYPEQYALMWFRRGSATIDHGGRTFTSHGADPFLVPAEDPYSFSLTPRHSQLVRVGRDFLEETAADLHGGPPQRIVFDHTTAPSATAVRRWRSVTAAATPNIVDAATEPLLRLESQLSIVRAMLELFPWRPLDLPASVRTERGVKVRLAAEYIHAHAGQAITPADIGRAAGLSPRALQLAMNEHFESSPTNYLRQVRLDRAHAELLTSPPGTARVSDVARRWGFGNLGRFAAAYAARFGEYPRTTLRRF